jgi:hypothetical protein
MFVREQRHAGPVLAAAVAAAVAVLAVGYGQAANAANNRAKPLKPQGGASFFEEKPTMVRFQWFLPEGESAVNIEISKSPKTDENGSFKQVTRRESLDPGQTEIRLGIRRAGRYYWHVSSALPDAEDTYGRASSFTVLNTLSNREAELYTQDAVGYRIPRKFNLKRLRCNRESPVSARCKWTAVAGDAILTGKGETFLSRKSPDNLRYYHYDYTVEIVSQACLKDDKGTRKKCTELVRWVA